MGLAHSSVRTSAVAFALAAVGAVAPGCGVYTGAAISAGQFPQDELIANTVELNDIGSGAINTVHDFEAAQRMAYAGLGQLEGLYRLRPEDETGLLMLNRSWASVAFAFIQDAEERATEAGEEQVAAYHRARGRAAYKRARFFGETLLARRTEGFEAARKNAETLKAWLAENYPDDDHIEELMWLGFAWIGWVAVDPENTEAVAELWIGVEMLDHVARIDETVQNGTVHVILGSYHARSAQAELDEAKQHFDRAIEISNGKLLTAQLNLAQRYYCLKRDQANYKKTLLAVIESADTFPEQRLSNVIAKRRARRYLGNTAWQEECGFDI